MHCIKYALILLLYLSPGCKPGQNEQAAETISGSPDSPSVNLDYHRLAKKIVDLADLQEGEEVLLMMAPGSFDPIIPALADEIESRSANYLGALSVTKVQPEAWNTRFVVQCLDKDEAELAEIFKEVKLGIMLPGASPEHMPYKILQDLLTTGGVRRTIHFHWAGAYDINGQLLETNDEIAMFYQQAILNTDYVSLSAHQQRFEDAMRNKDIRVTSPEGTDLSFRIGYRPVTKQDGNASARHTGRARNLIDREIEIPAGAVRVAPIEESVQGVIAFPDAMWNSVIVKDLRVTFQNGKVAEVNASEGAEAVKAEMNAAGETGKSFREFALGFNPLLRLQASPTPWIPYYGYGAGIVRLSLGDNTELGGRVGGGYVRWNFFTNTTVTVGDETWVKDGALLK